MPDVCYARSGGLSIAYQVFGDGPLDLVLIPGFVSHLELNWESPYRPMLERLRRFARLVVLDKRGTGLSDRSLGAGSAADRMDDVRAVMEAAGLQRAALFAISEGGPLAMLFAATFPERVSSLALFGTFARCVRDEGYPIGVPPERAATFPETVEQYWGSGQALRFIVQGAPEDAETQRHLARLERNCCTPAVVAEIMRSNFAIDVRSALSLVACPTFVAHQAGDPVIDVDAGRYVAEHIADSRFVQYPGDFHVSWRPEDHAELLDALEEFLTGQPVGLYGPREERVLATVLFTDIVSSTEQALRMGDRRWVETLDDHDRLIRQLVAEFGGRLVKTTGDGVLATFDGPARAIRCAQAIRAGAAGLGVNVRAGIHTGELELRGEDVAGVAVHIGARLSAVAEPGEILASRTVKDLVVGSELSFIDRGAHDLKGLCDQWQLYAVA